MKTQTVNRLKIFSAISLMVILLIGTYFLLPAKAAESGVNYADVPSRWIFGAEGVWEYPIETEDAEGNVLMLGVSSANGNNPDLEVHSQKFEIASGDIIDFSTWVHVIDNDGYGTFLIIDLYSSNLTKLTNDDYITAYSPADNTWEKFNLTITVPSIINGEVPKYAVLTISKGDFDVIPDFYYTFVECWVTPSSTVPTEGWGTEQFDLIAPYLPMLILTLVFCGVGVWQAGVWGLIAGLNTGIMLAYIFGTCSILFVIGIITVDGLMLFGKFSASKKEAT